MKGSPTTANQCLARFLTHGIETISESDLYNLILNSNQPQTEAFQNWTAGNAVNFIAKAVESVIGEEVSIEDALSIKAILQSKVQAFKDKEMEESDEYSTH
jgi:prophage antirepressor-like protein